MRSSLILGVFLLALAPSSPAQEVSGIRGKVVTDENRPLVDAEILIEIAGHSSIPQSVHTDVGGDYQTSNLQPGIYNLQIRAKNFGSVALRGVQVQIGKVTVVPATPLDLSAGFIVACPSDPRPDYYRLATGNSHTGAIAGIVTDDKRVAVRGATVSIYVQRLGRVSSTLTDKNGRFAFQEILGPFEKYWLSVTAPRHFSEELTQLKVQPGLEAVYPPIVLESCAPGRCRPDLKTIHVLPDCA